MRRRLIGAMGLAAAVLPAAGWSQFGPSGAVSMQRGDAGWNAAAFVCDSVDRARVLVLSPADRDGVATLTSLSKPALVAHRTRVRVGAAKAGMNQRWYPLTDTAGRPVGNVHAVNPQMVEPGATTPPVTSVTWGHDTAGCRFAPQTRVLGATAKRSIQVTGDARGGYRYRSYDHDAELAVQQQPWGGRDTRASLTIDGGRMAEDGGQRVYQFANRGFQYRVFASLDPARVGGGVQVWRDGRLVLSEPFGAYTAAT